MDMQEYISSGIIEDFCLGFLNEDESKAVLQKAQQHPEIKREIDTFMFALEQYATHSSFTPSAELKDKTMQLLANLAAEEEKNIQHLPMLNKHSDYKNWLTIVAPVLPQTLNEKMFVRELRNDDKVTQMIIWTHIDYPDEVHEAVQECFIILRGKCRCFIDDKVVELEAGGFLEIPMYTHHNVEVLGNEPVLAVVQRVKVA
jgi:mannose-6-phosphate isomerase-like protein (cupin superfamily)